MRVIVLGAGLLGVTTAYYLQQLGHEVIVVDRHATPAAKARGRAVADAAPPQSVPPEAPRARRGNGLWAGLRATVRQGFTRLLDRTSVAPPRSAPIDHLVRLAAYSRKNARALREETGLPQRPRSDGLLTIYTDTRAFEARMAGASRWSELGCEDHLLSADEAVFKEQALAAIRARLAGASFSPEDPARDPAQFAEYLVFLCRAAGVRFMMKHAVVALKERDGRVDHVELLDENGQALLLRGRSYVLALGASSAVHAEHLGIDMPMRFVREYIVTIPVKDPARAPSISLRDRQGRLRISRESDPDGDRLRVCCTVHVNHDEESEPDSDRYDAILRRVEMLFPGATDTTRASLDTAMHAVSGNRLPMIGKTRLPNLFLNTAPGTPGWTHAYGAGKSVARIVSGLRPEFDFAFRGL